MTSTKLLDNQHYPLQKNWSPAKENCLFEKKCSFLSEILMGVRYGPLSVSEGAVAPKGKGSNLTSQLRVKRA